MAKQPTIERSENYGYYSDLLWCAVPLTGMAWYYYGLRPVLLMLAALVTAYLCDCALAPLHGEGYRAHELSSECFAALIVLLMPASVSYGIVIAAVIAAVLVKEAFGGEGHYPFHPAAVGAAIAGVSWPEHVYYYPAPGTQLPIWGEINDNLVQGMNESLRSGGLPSASTMNLLTGNVSAGIGTGAALVILACGLVLWTQKDVHIGASASFLITCGLIAFFFPRQVGLADSTLFSSLLPRLQGIRDELHTGAVLFCAVFLLNEPYTCAHHRLGRILYGALVGAATMGFRYFGVYETGVCFALLAVNSVSALIDRTEERLYRLLHRLPSERKEAAE